MKTEKNIWTVNGQAIDLDALDWGAYEGKFGELMNFNFEDDDERREAIKSQRFWDALTLNLVMEVGMYGMVATSKVGSYYYDYVYNEEEFTKFLERLLNTV